jgi:hypothetical protein
VVSGCGSWGVAPLPRLSEWHSRPQTDSSRATHCPSTSAHRIDAAEVQLAAAKRSVDVALWSASAALPYRPRHCGASGNLSASRRGYGNLIIIQHNTVYSTAYAHLSTRAVRRGQRVRQGRVLATVGRSARSTGPHLHFEVRVRQQARDPIFYLPHPPKRLRWK